MICSSVNRVFFICRLLSKTDSTTRWTNFRGSGQKFYPWAVQRWVSEQKRHRLNQLTCERRGAVISTLRVPSASQYSVQLGAQVVDGNAPRRQTGLVPFVHSYVSTLDMLGEKLGIKQRSDEPVLLKFSLDHRQFRCAARQFNR